MRRVFDDLSRDEFGEPADVFAVTRDDELLDWLGAVDLDAEPAPPPAQDPADAELIEMLLAWRRSVTTNASELAPQPAPEAADTPGRRHAGRLRRVPAMSAVLAVLMVCVGLGVAVQDASPGDPLWGVSKALNSGRAASIEGTAQTRRYLDVAHTELLLGHQAAAAAALAAAQQQIAQMRSDDDKRELQARQRELANQLNSTPTSGQASGSRAATPPSRRREDRATSVRADEQQPRPSRSSIPHAAAPAGTPSTTTEPSMSNERETRTPDSSAAASDTPRPSRSATELTESAAIVAGSHVEDSRDSEHPPSRSATEKCGHRGSGVIRLVIRLGAATAHLGSATFGGRRSGRQHRSGFPLRTPRRVLTAILGDRCAANHAACPVPVPAHCQPRFVGVADPHAPRPPCPPVGAELDIELGGRSRRDGTAKGQTRGQAQGQDRPRAPPHVCASGHARPSPLQGLRRSRHERRSGLRPQGRHGHRRLLRATQRRDNPQLP